MPIIFIDREIYFAELWIVFYWIMILGDEFILLISYVYEDVMRLINVELIGFCFFINGSLISMFIFIFLWSVRTLLISAQSFVMIFDSSS